MTKTTGFRRGPQMMRLADRHEIATGIYSVRLIPHEPVPHVVPGTFLDLLLGGGHVLRRPLSIADADDEGYTLVFRVVGKGTDTLSVKPIGAEVDVLGPLGHGYDVDAVQPGGRALLIGGGVGIPPLYLLGRNLLNVASRCSSGWDSAIETTSFGLSASASSVRFSSPLTTGRSGRRGLSLRLPRLTRLVVLSPISCRPAGLSPC